MHYSKQFVLLAHALLASPSLSTSPPTTGPLLPRPLRLAQSPPFIDAVDNLTSLFDQAVGSSSFAGFTVNNASFSVAVTSFSAPEDNPVLWEYHYLAPEHSPNGTNETDGDSQYLIGSISKAFTDLLVLQSDLDLLAPITQYLPELNVSNNTIKWDEIRIQDLMDHLSGLPQNYGFPEVYLLVPLYEAAGFPTLDVSAFPSCGVIDLNPGCNETALLSALVSSSVHPVYSPNYTPSYNNLAFALLGIALHRQTGQSYASLLDSLTSSLNMPNTGVSPGTTSRAVIPPPTPAGLESSWSSDFGINAPQGGLYSSTNDISRFMHAILAHDERILPSVEIDAWLKPRSATSSLRFMYGAPWEIYRVPPSTLEGIETVVDVFVKDGGVVGYSARMIVVPRYGLGIVVLTAGPSGTPVEGVSEAVMAKLLPAIHEAGRIQARNMYAGEYEGVSTPTKMDDRSNSDDEMGVKMNFSVSIDDGPGLRVTSLFRNDTDILASLRLIQQSSIVVAAGLADDWRIYPAGWGPLRTETIMVSGTNAGNGTDNGHDNADDMDLEVEAEVEVTIEEWRLSTDPVPLVSPAQKQKSPLLRQGKGVFGDSIGSWVFADAMYYGGEAVDRVECLRRRAGIDGVDGDGEVLGWRFPALRGVVWRV